ncbi:hypothetical protein PG993_011615 [Apiospora rasikravindrae]|uniref:Uncharacterized protein n=1 Tax=Apiospora rasikravindrae TaxID=990691 RepID=A0ABR1S045_9PEZI
MAQTTNNDLNLTQILVKSGEVKAATEADPSLCAFRVSNGFAVLVMGKYLTPTPAPAAAPRLDRLEAELGRARTAGLLQLEAHILTPEPYSRQKAAAKAEADPMAAGLDDEEVLRWHLLVQKSLAQRMEQILRGGPVTWYKYPVCHQTAASRWTHGMSVYASKKVYCQSVDANGKSDEVRVIGAAKRGKEEEDSGRRCC